jgi:hypothetical protein
MITECNHIALKEKMEDCGAIFHFKYGVSESYFSSAATPGRTFPSKYSSNAPPPVDT